ncbi:DnaJ domain-containing protein [Lentinula guzmanii]|uniref:DnaJ domain-containing protein n=1 Tax=Lentinula guzmanii TaxID=2804957 RepID=A0AA38MU25_9AGAR|nr:DnaJ domain-containing protein [Lentinula guzmanii]
MLLISSLVSFNLFPRCRYFSASTQWLDYYRTLGVSPQASKAQIKSHFYQLSKKHHPDVSSDPKSKEIYAAVSAAYSVLSNDRERRAYDKKMQQEHRSSMSMSHYASNFHPSADHNGEWSRRHPGATHAWARRPHTPHPNHKHNPAGSASHSNFDSAHQAFRNSSHKSSRNNVNPSFIYANAATDGDKSIFRRKTEAVHRDREKIERISGSFRALQVLLVLVLISAVAAPRMGPGTVIITRQVALPNGQVPSC